MVEWRLVAATAAVLALAACTSTDGSNSPRVEPSASSTPTATPTPLSRDSLTPAVMLSSIIRTPSGPIRTGIAHPATFVQSQAGFVVQDTAGVVYRVEDDRTSRIGRADPTDGLTLITHVTGRNVAWAYVSDAERSEWRVQVYDSHRRRLVLDTTIRTRDGLLHNLVLDNLAMYYASGEHTVVRRPLGIGDRTELDVAHAHLLKGVAAGYLELIGTKRTRLVPVRGAGDEVVLEPAGSLSPTGAYAWSTADNGRVAIRDVATGRDLTPALTDGSARHLTWIGPDSFTVEVATTSLISPPDGDVWHLDVCRVSTGGCRSALTGVTGTALSIPGIPVRSTWHTSD